MSPASAAFYGCVTSSQSRNVVYVTDRVFQSSYHETIVVSAFTPRFDFVNAYDWQTYCPPWDDAGFAAVGFQALKDHVRALYPTMKFIEAAPPRF